MVTLGERSKWGLAGHVTSYVTPRRSYVASRRLFHISTIMPICAHPVLQPGCLNFNQHDRADARVSISSETSSAQWNCSAHLNPDNLWEEGSMAHAVTSPQ